MLACPRTFFLSVLPLKPSGLKSPEEMMGCMCLYIFGLSLASGTDRSRRRGQNWYMSWALKVDLNFNGEYGVRNGEEPREREIHCKWRKEKWHKDKKSQDLWKR